VRYLLDTSAVIAHLRQESGWQAVQALLEDEENEILLAAPSIAEFSRRVVDLGASTEETITLVSDYVELFTAIVSIDAGTASMAFTIGCRCAKRLPIVDSFIAAAAYQQTAVLVHRDEHMRGIPPDLVRQLDLAD
jgi:predicted nucleic acid-binding protein